MTASDPEKCLDNKSIEADQHLLPPRTTRPSRYEFIVRRIVPSLLVLFVTWTVFRSISGCHHHHSHDGKKHYTELEDVRLYPVHDSNNRVELEAHIMSKCPDARDCLQQLVVPAMARVSDKVNFTLSYIGSYDPNSDAVACKHGPEECLGNIIELCAAKIYPDPKIYLGFTNCMTSDYRDIPKRDLVEGCAMEHGIDFGKLNSCISEEGEGASLLRASFERSKTNNVSISCTVRLAGKVRCVRDAGTWYDCPGGSSVSDLVHDIEELYG